MEQCLTVAPLPPDPGWTGLALPGWQVDFIDWPLRSDGEPGPPDEAMHRLASALAACATVVFFTQHGHIAVPPGLRRQGMAATIGITWSRDAALVGSLFKQPGLDWSQRGQIVFLFPPDGPFGEPNTQALFATAAEDPPRNMPPGCTGLVRPGTDGAFAELATADPHLRRALLAALLQH